MTGFGDRCAVPVAALLLVLCGAGACGERRADPVDRVILVSIDSLRADHLGIYGYDPPTSPAIDALGASGLVFERAYSTTSWTLPAHAALFSGLEDFAHGVVDDRRLPEAVETLAEALRKSGVKTIGFFAGPYLHPAFGLSQGFDRYVDCTSYAWKGRGTGEPFPDRASHRDVTNPLVLDRVRRWLEGADPSARTFVFIHLWDVHHDYIAPRSYVEMFDPDYTGSLTGWKAAINPSIRVGMPESDYRHLLAQYDAEIRYTDDTLAEMLRAFEARGMLANSAIILLADHGTEFLDHGGTTHRKTLYEEVVRVPLIIHIPDLGSSMRRVRDVVSIVDVYPTICDLFGADCPVEVRRRSLLAYLEDGGARRVPGEALLELTTRKTRQVALVRGDRKVIHWPDTDGTRYFELEGASPEGPGLTVRTRDLKSYPEDVRDIVLALRNRARAARVAGEALRTRAPEPEIEIPEATQEHLRALGYTE